MINKMLDKHKEKLMRSVENEVTTMFEKILDYAEVAVPNNDQYKKLRSKILRSGNNCIRNLGKEINNRYDIKYIPPAETIIESKVSRGKA
jgi:hypothetical protein